MNIKTKTQKLILYTSDVAHAKVITTGEPTMPSLLVTALPSINDLFAGISCARNLLQAQPAKSQRILHKLVDLDDLHLRAQPIALQCILHVPVDLDNLCIGNNDVYKCDIRPTMPCPRLAMCYKLHIMPMMPCLMVITRSLLVHHYNPSFKVYKGDYAESFPERIIDCNGKQTCILPVTQAITKCNTSGELIAMDLKTFARVPHAHSFGRHMPVGPTGIQLSVVYYCHELAEHTVLAGFQFNPCGYLSRGFVFDPGGFTQLLKSL